ncbi:MAG: DNA topoisomerase III [Bacteroidales bacterium]|nr:DNA topoisomerase III [Bacteroidales bacterium]
MKLCIAEKPSVAREIARIVGANTRHDGYFEGNGYWVSYTFGHLCTLKTPDDYNARLKWWKLHDLPIIPQKFSIKLIENDGSKRQFKVSESLIQNPKCEELINCGDAGQEGELIQRWVYHKAGNKKPVKRLWISSLTEEAIKEGFANLQEESKYQHLYEAGSARAIGDWLLGINASRLYTLKYGSGKNVLSIGRVQTPTLAMIVQRHHEITQFVSQDFWEVKTKYRDVAFSYEKGRFFEQEKAEAMMLKIAESVFTILSFEKKKGKEYAPRLFDLTSLQVESNKKFNLTADETLKTVQQLYEKKLVSYPRVDTSYLPEDQHPKIPNILKGLLEYAEFTQRILSKPIPKTKRVFDNKKITDHHAIIPTGVSSSNLSGPERDVYDAIVRRFIANFLPVCEISNTKVVGEASGFTFRATGKEILSPGWRVLFGQEQDTDNQQLMPTFEKGESGTHEPGLEKKQTQAPKYYTEATLLRAMETAGKQVEDEEMREMMKANGIGRPSTRANIIETLFRRRYVSRKRKALIPNPTGIELIGSIQNDLLKSAELTGQWELKLGQIEQGKYDVKLFLSEMKAMVTELMAEVKKESAKAISFQETHEPKKKTSKAKKKTTPPKLICPKCGKGNIIKGKTAYGCSQWKTGCDFKILFEELKSKYQSESVTTEVLQKWKV